MTLDNFVEFAHNDGEDLERLNKFKTSIQNTNPDLSSEDKEDYEWYDLFDVYSNGLDESEGETLLESSNVVNTEEEYIDCLGMGILTVMNKLEDYVSRGNAGELTVQSSDGGCWHSYFTPEDWTRFKNSVNEHAAITKVWIKEVPGNSFKKIAESSETLNVPSEIQNDFFMINQRILDAYKDNIVDSAHLEQLQDMLASAVKKYKEGGYNNLYHVLEDNKYFWDTIDGGVRHPNVTLHTCDCGNETEYTFRQRIERDGYSPEDAESMADFADEDLDNDMCFKCYSSIRDDWCQYTGRDKLKESVENHTDIKEFLRKEADETELFDETDIAKFENNATGNDWECLKDLKAKIENPEYSSPDCLAEIDQAVADIVLYDREEETTSEYNDNGIDTRTGEDFNEPDYSEDKFFEPFEESTSSSKSFEEVKKGDVGEDYDGNKVTILAKGPASNFSGADGFEEFVDLSDYDPEDKEFKNQIDAEWPECVLVQFADDGSEVVYSYGSDGVIVPLTSNKKLTESASSDEAYDQACNFLFTKKLTKDFDKEWLKTIQDKVSAIGDKNDLTPSKSYFLKFAKKIEEKGFEKEAKKLRAFVAKI